MQPTVDQQITVTGNLTSKKTPLSIDAEDMPHILGILTRNYSDQAMAVLREYSANARDSHVEAGKADVPIEVTLPSAFQPYLIIKDYGLGMSVDFVENRYAKYGASEKRGERGKGIGGFGIGGKSALAYTDSFRIITVKDNEKGHFTISRAANGAAELDTFPPTATDEPNSVTIMVQAKDVNDFTEKAAFLFKFWPEGSVLVNGEAPERHSGKKIGDNIWYSEGASQSYVTMGGIPYRVANPQRYLSYNYQRFHFIAEIEIDGVDITPSREDLEYTPRTIARLQQIGKDFEASFKNEIKKWIDDAPDAPSAWDKWFQWKTWLGNSAPATYKGKTFYDTMTLDNPTLFWKYGGAYRYSYQPTHTNTIEIQVARKAIFVTGRADLSSYTKSRIRLWADHERKPLSHVYFVDKAPECEWVKNLTVVDWSEIIKVKPERSTSGSAGTVEVINEKGYFETINRDDLEDSPDLLVVTPAQSKSMPNRGMMMQTLTKFRPDVTLVKIPENRWKKFKKDFPQSGVFNEYFKDVVRIEAAAIPKINWEIDSLDGNSRFILKRIGSKGYKVNDPEVARMAKMLNDDKVDNDLILRINRMVNASGILVNIRGDGSFTGNWLNTNYPLIDSMYPHNIDFDELVIYMNAAYAARKDN